MRQIVNIIVGVLILLNVSNNVFAWGQKGHDVVACIAEQHLTEKAKENIDKILGGKSLIYYSSWMDNVQNSPYWNGGYDRTKTWHYFNVDEGYTPQKMPRNPKGDVLSAMNMLIDSLGNHQNELSDSVKFDYLRMLIHLVGDMHCPMHVGRLSDRGGNEFSLKWFNQKTNLHSIWDYNMVERVHSWSYTEWQQNLDRCSQSEIEEMSGGKPEDWLNETWKITCGIYDYVKPDENYSYKFMYDYAQVVERQLLVAGYRLAALLNKIFG